MTRRPLDFESSASANSATLAWPAAIDMLSRPYVSRFKPGSDSPRLKATGG